MKSVLTRAELEYNFSVLVYKGIDLIGYVKQGSPMKDSIILSGQPRNYFSRMNWINYPDILGIILKREVLISRIYLKMRKSIY